MRIDASLLLLYNGPQKAHRRRKKYDGIVNFDALAVIVTDDPLITLRSTIAYSVALKRSVHVVMVRKQRSNGKYMEALLFATDIKMTALDVYEYYRARFQIEFVIRDAKQNTGLTHCQSRDKDRIDFHINISFAAVNIARINEQERTAGALAGTPSSVATQKVRAHNEMLIQSIFPMFGLDPLAFKSTPAYEQALNYEAIHV